MINKALVHRPSTTLMTPKGAIDNTVPVNFSFAFDGYICKTVNLVFYTGLSPTPSLIKEYSVTEYNGSRITVTLPAGELTSDAVSYYGIDVGGENRTVAIDSSNVKLVNISNHGLNTGDEVSINNGASSSFKAEQYVNVLTRDLFYVYASREQALLGGDTNAIAIPNGSILRPWGRSDRVAIQMATRNVNLRLSTTEITSQKWTLIPEYTRPPVANLVIRFRCYIYDIEGNIVNDSGEIFSGNIRYTFSGFLANTIYQIRFTAVDEYNYFYDTGKVSVSVLFDIPDIVIKPEATNLCYESCIRLSWGEIIQIVGNITGDVDYLDNWVIEGNTAILLKQNSTLSFDITIPKESAPLWLWSPNGNGFDGIVSRLDNETTGDSAYLSYNNNGTTWYLTINGRTTLLKKEKIYPTSIYLIAFYGTSVYIREIVDLDRKHNKLNFNLESKTNIL